MVGGGNVVTISGAVGTEINVKLHSICWIALREGTRRLCTEFARTHSDLVWPGTMVRRLRGAADIDLEPIATRGLWRLDTSPFRAGGRANRRWRKASGICPHHAHHVV